MRLTISLDDELYRYIRARSKREDTSMSAVINAIVGKEMTPTYEGGSLPLPSLAERWPVFEGPFVDPPPVIPTSTGAIDLMLDLEKEEELKRQGSK
jgi:hypothetical protein